MDLRNSTSPVSSGVITSSDFVQQQGSISEFIGGISSLSEGTDQHETSATSLSVLPCSSKKKPIVRNFESKKKQI